MNDEENFVRHWLSNPWSKGKRSKPAFRVEQFTEDEKKKSKTPDFRVYSGENFAFYCEVKTISPDDWPESEYMTNSPFVVGGGIRKDNINDRISTKIHEAVQQFDAVNPLLEHPNVLIFINRDEQQWSVNELNETLTGCAQIENGAPIPMFLRCAHGRIRGERGRIHLYVWIDVPLPLTNNSQSWISKIAAFHFTYVYNEDHKVHCRNLKRLFPPNRSGMRKLTAL